MKTILIQHIQSCLMISIMHTENRFNAPEFYDHMLTDKLKEKIASFDGSRRYAVDLMKLSESLFMQSSTGDDSPATSFREIKDTLLEVNVNETEQADDDEATLIEIANLDSDDTEAIITYKCKCCRSDLFTSLLVQKHDDTAQRKKCQNIFLFEAPSWQSVVAEGKILCPNAKCQAKLGSWSWCGCQCSCGTWVCPSFQFSPSKIDTTLKRI